VQQDDVDRPADCPFQGDAIRRRQLRALIEQQGHVDIAVRSVRPPRRRAEHHGETDAPHMFQRARQRFGSRHDRAIVAQPYLEHVRGISPASDPAHEVGPFSADSRNIANCWQSATTSTGWLMNADRRSNAVACSARRS
jgi:hypothetical protein